MVVTAGVDGGICKSFSAMGIGFGFNNPTFSDWILRIEVTIDPLESDSSKLIPSEAEESQHSEVSPSSSASPRRITTVQVNSLVLASQSPFFYKMFSNGMSGSKHQIVTLSIKGSEELAFLDFLEFLYTNTLKASSHVDLFKVLVLADRYQVDPCVTYCAQTLSLLPMTFELATPCINLPSHVLEGSNSYLRSLVETVKCFLSKTFSWHFGAALNLPLESIESLLLWDALEVDCEDEVYDFVLLWARTHYKDLSERQQVYSSRLLRLIRFPYMSCEKLKSVLQCEELEEGEATKMVVEALLSKSGNRLSQVLDLSPHPARAYRWLPVEVTLLKGPYKQCIVYADLKKEECRNLVENCGVIFTQDFCVGNESFYLLFKRMQGDASESSLLGVTLERTKSEPETSPLTEIAVRLKSHSTKFTALQKAACAMSGNGEGLRYKIGKSWDSFMAEGSRYFIDGVLYIRFTITLLH